MTPTVKVRVVENRLVSPVIAAADIALSLATHGSVNIDLMSEAPTIDCCELGPLFDFLESKSLDLSRITINTGNMLESSQKVNIVHRPDFMYELRDFQRLARTHRFETKSIRYHFGHMASRCNLPRLLIGSWLFDRYRHQTWQTFHWRHDHDYHRIHLAMDELLYHYGAGSDEARQAWKLLQAAPLLHEPANCYPIVPRTQSDIIASCQWHHSFFVDIVCETVHDETNFFLTEKFWRTIVTRTPFILHGPRWLLENLRCLGFHTFHDWWDEGYSQDPGLHRIVEIKKVIDFLAGKSLEHIQDMYQDMQPVLEHNFQTFLALDFEDLRSVKVHHDI